MGAERRSISIFMATADPDNCELTSEALEALRFRNPLHFVSDGEDLMEYLNRTSRYQTPDAAPRPELILLDLNLPRTDGCVALQFIKSDPQLRTNPTVILTTSSADEEVCSSSDPGANSFITKPATFDRLVGADRALGADWFEIVDLPVDERDIHND